MRKSSVGEMQHKSYPSSKVKNETEVHWNKQNPPNKQTNNTPKIIRLSVCELISLKPAQLLPLQCLF